MSQSKHMTEAEVALQLAEYLLRKVSGVTEATVSIDGAAAKKYEIESHVREHGWRQKERRGKNQWTGCYESDGKRLEINCRPGEGDIVASVGSSKFIAECKKGPRQKSANGQERKLLAEAIGQATKWPVRPRDFVVVAVPRTDEFMRVGQDWLRAPLFQRTGIAIVLVGEDGSVQLLRGDTAEELDTLMPSILSKAFSGEL